MSPPVTEPADLDFGYLTTVGRVTGRPHRIEIWFALRDGTVYLLSGNRERSDWVANLLADPRVGFELGGQTLRMRARVLDPRTEEDALARRLLVEKYTPRDPDDLTGWGRTALPVALDRDPRAAGGPL